PQIVSELHKGSERLGLVCRTLKKLAQIAQPLDLRPQHGGQGRRHAIQRDARNHSSKIFPHLASAARRTSGLDSATGGKSAIHSYGLQASMMARELCPFSALGTMGSRGPLQLRRTISMSVSGSERVARAHSTSLVLVTSM